MAHPGGHGDDPFAQADEPEPYTLDSTYWPAQGQQEHSGSASYMPPAQQPVGAAHDLISPATTEDDAFAAASQATTSTGAVPAVGGARGGGGGNSVVLQFAETAPPSEYAVTGRMGSPAVPKVEAFRPTRPLLSRDAPRSHEDPEAAAPADWGSYSFLNVKRYRQYFNVDTGDVLGRIADSVVGSYKSDFIEKTEGSADLYGPFWIATTLIFVSAVTGNYASYLSYERSHPSDIAPSPAGAGGGSTSDKVWYYDINKVSYSAILFYGYVGVVGLALWAVLKYFKSAVSLAQIWCTYGYALSVFIPISFVCIFPYEALRWALVAAATATSGLFIMINLRHTVFEHAGAKALPVYATMGCLHLALGLVLKLYFFHYW